MGPSATSTGKTVVGHQPQTPLASFVSFFVRLSRFSVPTTIQREHRVAGAVKAGRRCVGAAGSTFARPRLDGTEHGARLDGRDDRSRDGRRDVILDWAVNVQCGSTASPCIRSGARTRYPNLSCTGESKAQNRRDPSTKTVGLVPRLGTVTRLSWVTSAVISRGRLRALA